METPQKTLALAVWLFFAGAGSGALPAAAAEADTVALALRSVVSVLPVWPEPERRRRAVGKPGEEPERSAVAIRPGGLLVTAAHVVARATDISDRLGGGHILPARLVGTDKATDVALLKIARDLPVIASAPEPRLGTRACALGNAFGMGLSVTCGVVSATRRAGVGFNPIEDFIQTDAVVNPGTSGGALIDDRRRLLGVISAIFTKGTDADIGVNFAASAALVERVVEDLATHGRVPRGRPGLLLAKLPRARQASTVGALIRIVRPRLDADAAGLQSGDIITAVGTRSVRSPAQAHAAIDLHRIGQTFPVKILRNKKLLTVKNDPAARDAKIGYQTGR